MPIKQESFNEKLYDFLKSNGFDPLPKNSRNETVPIPEADVFNIKIKDGDKEFSVWITIDNANTLKIYYDDEVLQSDEDDSESFYKLLKNLKNWSLRRQLSFEPKNRNHLDSDMSKREYMKKKETLGEGYYPVGKKTSFSDSVPTVKILLMHTRNLEEGEQRFRNVAKIFVENVNGERFLVPTIRPGIARVYARHIAEGGTPYDDKGKHITTVVEEYTKMAGFVRATKNGQFNESAQRLVNEGLTHYDNLRSQLQSLTTRRGYNQYFDSWTPVLNEETTEDTTINELFVQETLDPRIESVMPILARLRKNITEMEEVQALDEWAETLINEKLLDDPKKKDEIVSEEKKEIFLVVDRNNPSKAEGFWDGAEFVPFDKTKYKAGRLSMVPGHLVVYRGDGPLGTKELDYIRATREGKSLDEAPGAMTLKHNQDTEENNLKAFGLAEGPADEPEHEDTDADDKRWDDKEEGEEEVDEGKNIKYFYVTVDGEEKFKTKNELEAHRAAKEMKANKSFDGKTIDVVEKEDYQVQIGEDEFAGDYAIGVKGQWRNTGPKKNKPAERGDLVGESENVELDKIKTLSGIK